MKAEDNGGIKSAPIVFVPLVPIRPRSDTFPLLITPSAMSQDYYQQGLAQAKAGDLHGAIASFELAAIATPAWGELYYRRGLAHFDLGDLVSAVGDYTQALSLDPQHRDSHYARALARLMLKNFPGALADIERAIIYGRDWAVAYQLKGKICRKLAQYPAAIAAYKMAATLYLAQQDPERSRECLEIAQQMQPKSETPPPPAKPAQPFVTPEQFYAQLLERGERGDLQVAIQDANWAVQTNPDDVRAYCCRGMLQLKQGDRSAALVDFNRAIEIDPESQLAYRSRGKLREQMGDYHGALLDLDRALASDPQDLFTYLARAHVRISLNNYTEALTDLKRAIEIAPREPTAYVHRAQIYIKLERLSEAIADYQTAVNIYLDSQNLPKYQETLASLNQIQRSIPKSTLASSGGSTTAVLRQRLLVLVGGHWAIAQRAIEHLKEQYPGQSEEWYLEQAIFKIERG